MFSWNSTQARSWVCAIILILSAQWHPVSVASLQIRAVFAYCTSVPSHDPSSLTQVSMLNLWFAIVWLGIHLVYSGTYVNSLAGVGRWIWCAVPSVALLFLLSHPLPFLLLIHSPTRRPAPPSFSFRPCDVAPLWWFPVTVHPPPPGCLPSHLL